LRFDAPVVSVDVVPSLDVDADGSDPPASAGLAEATP
jgi:hypothetical protein